MSPVTDFDVLRPQGTPPIAAVPFGEPVPDRPSAVEPAWPAPPATRKRRAYQVWERATLSDVDLGEQWSVVAEAEEATSRSVAIRQATGGRAGTFATVLVGEFVEEIIDNPEAVLAGQLALAMQERLGDRITAEEARALALEVVGASEVSSHG